MPLDLTPLQNAIGRLCEGLRRHFAEPTDQYPRQADQAFRVHVRTQPQDVQALFAGKFADCRRCRTNGCRRIRARRNSTFFRRILRHACRYGLRLAGDRPVAALLRPRFGDRCRPLADRRRERHSSGCVRRKRPALSGPDRRLAGAGSLLPSPDRGPAAGASRPHRRRMR